MNEQSPQAQETLSPELRSEIEVAFDKYWSDAAAGKDEYWGADDLEEERKKALERELGFARKVTSAATEMANRHSGPVVLLFDVDETIARNEYTSGSDDFITYVRPAFAPTLAVLRTELGDRLEVGLLTSRGESHLDEQLENPTYLTDAMDIVNPEFVLSSQTDSRVFKQTIQDTDGDTYEDWDHDLKRLDHREREALAYCEDILKPEIVQEVTDEGYSDTNPDWWNIKLAILQKVAANHPERAFVFVEDLWCADSVRDDHPQVMGVHVDEDAGFFSI